MTITQVNLFVAELVKAFVTEERESHHLKHLEQLQRASCATSSSGACVPIAHLAANEASTSTLPNSVEGTVAAVGLKGLVAVKVAAEAGAQVAPAEEVAAATLGPPPEAMSRPPNEPEEFVMQGDTCFCCDPTAPWRRMCQKVLMSEAWKAMVLLVVIASCVSLALESRSTLEQRQQLLEDYAITAFFTLEALMKIFVCGIICGPHTYFRSNWNCLDFVILVASCISLVDARLDGGGALRVLRVLRPLRLVKRVPGMAVNVSSLRTLTLTLSPSPSPFALTLTLHPHPHLYPHPSLLTIPLHSYFTPNTSPSPSALTLFTLTLTLTISHLYPGDHQLLLRVTR